MKTHQSIPDYKGYRFPPEIISHCVWLYFCLLLSFRDVEDLMAQRGVVLTYETVRQWCVKFGHTYADELRHRRPRCGDKKKMRKFKSAGQVQRFLSAFGPISGHFQPRRHRLRTKDYPYEA